MPVVGSSVVQLTVAELELTFNAVIEEITGGVISGSGSGSKVVKVRSVEVATLPLASSDRTWK